MNLDAVAFHELVNIRSWTDSSSRGSSIKVGLPGRDALDVFEKVTRRANKRAGQRYAAVWQDTDATWEVTMDLWFAGANWSHQDGATVKFSILGDDLQKFQRGRLQIGDPPFSYWLTLVQIDDDEKPIDQKKAERMEELKGGPHSKRVAMLTQQDDFQQYVAYRLQVDFVDMEGADKWVKETCGIASKRELDHNAEAWETFQVRVMSPFVRWGENVRWQSGEDEGS